MYPDPNIYRFLQELQTYMGLQNKKMDQLEMQVQHIQDEVAALKKQKQITIEKIEYNFDQLKIETLEGTLTIGIPPAVGGQIDEFEVNGQRMEDVPIQPYGELIQNIKNQIDQFIKEKVPSEMLQMEKKYKTTLDQTYRDQIVEDIKRQIDARIRHYINKLQPFQQTGGNIESAQREEKVIQLVKKDIQAAIETFLKNLPGRRDESL